MKKIFFITIISTLFSRYVVNPAGLSGVSPLFFARISR